MKILIGCTGSVAAIKLPNLVNELLDTDIKARIAFLLFELIVKL